jgi:hypothetical protein
MLMKLAILSGLFAAAVVLAPPTSHAAPVLGAALVEDAAGASMVEKAHYGGGYYGYRWGYYAHYPQHHYRPLYYYPPYQYYRGYDWCRAWHHECAKRWGWGGWRFRQCLWRHDC